MRWYFGAIGKAQLQSFKVCVLNQRACGNILSLGAGSTLRQHKTIRRSRGSSAHGIVLSEPKNVRQQSAVDA
jgi:hypothetical protein